MSDNLMALREKAEKATPGPWKAYDDGAEALRARAFVSSENGPVAWISARAGGDPGEILSTADAEYIAAADPPTVLNLIADNEELRADQQRLRVGLGHKADDLAAMRQRAERAEAKIAATEAVIRKARYSNYHGGDVVLADDLREARGGGQ